MYSEIAKKIRATILLLLFAIVQPGIAQQKTF